MPLLLTKDLGPPHPVLLNSVLSLVSQRLSLPPCIFPRLCQDLEELIELKNTSGESPAWELQRHVWLALGFLLPFGSNPIIVTYSLHTGGGAVGCPSRQR